MLNFIKSYKLCILFIVSFFAFLYLSLFPIYSQNNKKNSFIQNLEYKWGDSPFNEEGKPVWTISETENWMECKGQTLLRKDKDHFLWYRLKIDGEWENDQVLFLPEVLSFFEVYSGEQKIYQFGEISKSENQKFLGFPWHLIPLRSEYKNNYLFIRVYSEFLFIGVTKGIILESNLSVFKRMVFRSIPIVAIGFFSFVIGVLSWFLKNKTHQKEYQYFSLFAISASFTCIASSEIKQFFLDKPVFWFQLAIVFAYLIPISNTGFLKFWVNEKYKKVFQYLQIFYIIFAIINILYLFFEINQFLKYFLLFLYFLIFLEIFKLILLLLSSLKRNVQKQFLAFGFFVYVFSAFWDILSLTDLIPYETIRFFPWGVFIFTSIHVIMLNNFLNIVSDKKETYKQNLLHTNQELKHTNTLLEEYNKNLENKINERTQLLNLNKNIKDDAQRIMRHDLKMPLSGIIGYTELLLADPTLSEEAKGLADHILKSGQKMRYMINNSLDLFKMEEGTYELTPVQFNFIKLFQKINNELIEFKKSKSVQLLYFFEDKIINWTEILYYAGESLHLENLFANLIKNAIEASPDNEKVTVSIYNREDHVETIIHNKGAVPKEIRKKFFERYTTSGKKGGTGLGTYSAYLITKAHKGEISFTTSKKEGTILFVKLPKYGNKTQ